jgi:copper(I)-binding protein
LDNLKFLAGAVFLMFLGSLASAQDIKITDAYARSAGKMAKSGAAFLVIENLSGTEDRLMEVWSDAAKRVQLHTHIKGDDGVMKMRHVEQGFVIPAQGQHTLKRGGDHIMFMGLVTPWEDGDVLNVTLHFEKAGDVPVSIPVDQNRNPMEHKH